MTVIPDSIEPYLGYKALAMSADSLCSPSHHATWPKLKPLVSECKNPSASNPVFSWRLVPAPEGWEAMYWVSSEFLKEGATTTFSWPTSDPPPGFTWIPDESVHDMKQCTCGIYAVDNPDQCASYMAGPSRVLVEVALWGQVVMGDKGARGQYAYPQKIFAAAQQQEQAMPVAEAYDIHLEIVRFHR